MPNSRGWIKPIFSSIGLVLSLIGWVILSPSAIGGNTHYIILIGNSMEPDFFRGDLVLVQPAHQYNIGDIVAYTQPDVGTIFHRIVDISDDGFTLKGDHNSWEDSYFPNEEEILGKFWIKIPSAGTYLQYLRKPGLFAIVVLGFSGLILFTLFFDHSRKKGNSVQENISSVQKVHEEDDMDNKISDEIYLVSAVGFLALILIGVSFAQPIETSTADNYEYTHIGNFEYYSYVTNDVYEDNILQSGDPIFRQLNNSFNIIFSYELKSDHTASMQGTYRLLAKISEASGWERTIEIIPPSLIVENSFTSEGTLDLSDIQELTDNYEEQTGIYNNRFTLTITPEVSIQGKIGGRNFSDIFVPELPFSFDDQKLILIDDTSDSTDVLNPVQGSTVLGTKETDNTLSILGFELDILLARFIAIYLLLMAIIALLWISHRQQKTANKINNEKPAAEHTEKNV
jgi:signal peptidase I